MEAKEGECGDGAELYKRNPDSGGRGAAAGATPEEIDASPDDPDAATSGLVGAPLVAQLLGGTVIDEIRDDLEP